MTSKSSSSVVMWLLLAVLIGLAAYLFYPQEQGSNGARQNKAVPVKTAIVSIEPYTESIYALGTAQANEAVEITASSSDYIDSVMFDDNQLITQGQPLVTLRSQEEMARVTELKATLNEQKRQLQRFHDLAKENATSESLLDEQASRVKVTEAQIEVAKTRLNELSIAAPFGGVLGLRQVSPGSYVTPGSVITTLDDISLIKVEFSIPEKYLPDLAQGQTIYATTQAWGDEIFNGSVLSIDSRVDPATRSVRLRAGIKNEAMKLRPGMLLDINIEKSTENTMIIPEKALIPQQDKQFVFVVDTDNKVSKIEVKTGRRQPGFVEILSGLKEGQQIVIEGAMRIRNGSTVKAVGA